MGHVGINRQPWSNALFTDMLQSFGPKSLYTGQSQIVGWRLITKGSILVFVRFEYTRRVKAGRRTNPGRENPAAGPSRQP